MARWPTSTSRWPKECARTSPRSAAGSRRPSAAAARRAAAARGAGRRRAFGQRAEPGAAAVEASLAADGLRAIFEAADAFGIVHCCAAHPPFGIITAVRRARHLPRPQPATAGDEDPLAEAADGGAGIFAGTVQAADPERAVASELAKRVIDLWRRIGLPPARCAEQVVLRPACGLAGTSPERAAELLAACREAGRILPEMIEEGTGDQGLPAWP